MLVQFSVTNFKSIRETAELSMLEANITEFTDSLIRNRLDGVGILPVAMLYGANGSGKSAVLEAMSHLKALIGSPDRAMPLELGFAMGAAMGEEPTAYDLVFRGDYREYEYQLKVQGGMVREETLYIRKLTDTTYDVVFDRDPEGVYLGEWLESLDISPVTDTEPLLSYILSEVHTEEFDMIRSLIGDMVYMDCSEPDDKPVTVACRHGAMRRMLVRALACGGTGIQDISEEGGTIIVRHEAGTLPLEAEGHGVRQAVRLYAAAVQALTEGKILLADDVNQKLHPKVFRFLLELFTNPAVNTKGAQLIGTSYDMPTMANRVLRRDEIWLCDRNDRGETSLYTLALFLKENGEKVRKDETYFKQFLEGRYGTDVVQRPMVQEERA
ncbi:MAG TPA: hypothetical protein DF613_12300 [Lachnospiraceae bacterium]|nr:hypothetical protein [Lachnospiraceae bacterium]